jgi:hypothetical protein
MHGISRVKAEPLKFATTLKDLVIDRHALAGRRREEPYSVAQIPVGDAFDLDVHQIAAHPGPLSGLQTRDDREHGLRFQPDAILRLVVKRTAEAATIEVDPRRAPR